MVRVSHSISFSVARRSAFTLAVAAAAPSHRSDSSSKLPMPCSVRKQCFRCPYQVLDGCPMFVAGALLGFDVVLDADE